MYVCMYVKLKKKEKKTSQSNLVDMQSVHIWNMLSRLLNAHRILLLLSEQT